MSIVVTNKTDVGLKQYLFGIEPPTKLNLSYWRITDAGLQTLADLTSLQELNLCGTQVTDDGLKVLTGLPNLQKLCLIDTFVTDAGLKVLAGLPSLQELNLLGTLVTDAGLKALAGMKLKILVIPVEARTDTGFKHYLQAIDTTATLDLLGWPVTDAGLIELSGLKSLQKLYLYGNRFTPAGIAELKKALPECKIYRNV